MPLLLDLPKLDRLVAACAAYTAARLDLIAARPGNPLGAETRRDGRIVAMMARRFAHSEFNALHGACDDNLDAASEFLAWYAAEGVSPRVVLTPGRPVEALGAKLAAAGYAQSGFHAAFAGPAALPALGGGDVEVIRLTSRDQIPEFEDAYHAGWDLTRFRVPTAGWLALPGWSLYLARLGGRAVGTAMLFEHAGVGYLADSAVIADARGQGVHAALLDARCADAAAAGVEFIGSQAAFLSGSARNMLRKGLTLAFTQAVWTKA